MQKKNPVEQVKGSNSVKNTKTEDLKNESSSKKHPGHVFDYSKIPQKINLAVGVNQLDLKQGQAAEPKPVHQHSTAKAVTGKKPGIIDLMAKKEKSKVPDIVKQFRAASMNRLSSSQSFQQNALKELGSKEFAKPQRDLSQKVISKDDQLAVQRQTQVETPEPVPARPKSSQSQVRPKMIGSQERPHANQI